MTAPQYDPNQFHAAPPPMPQQHPGFPPTMVPQQVVGVPQFPGHQPTVMPVKTNHAMHLVLSLITCGMWLPVWIIVAMVNSSRTRRVY